MNSFSWRTCCASVLAAVALALSGCDRAGVPPGQDADKAAASTQSKGGASGAGPAAPDPASPEGRLLGQSWSGDLNGMLERRYVRVLVVPDKMNFFFDGTQVRGVTYDVMREFESFLNKKFERTKQPIGMIFVPTRRDEIFRAIADGKGDLAAGNLGISDERRQVVDFSVPVRDKVKVVPVASADAPALKSLDDLAGKTVYVPQSSVFPGLIATLNRKFKSEGKPEIVVQPADENLEPADILEMVNAGIVSLTLSDSLTAEFWAKVFDQIHVYSDLPVIDTGATAWAFRKSSPQLKAAVDEFVSSHREGTAYGNTILRKYLRDTKWAKNATSDAEIKKFNDMVALFRKYGDQANLPYLLVVAQAYQESGLDQSVKSPVGAVGVLQIKPATAAGKPIEVQNVDKLENNVKAGTKYLRFLMDQYYKDEPMDRVTKGLFAIASYNAGPAKIRQLRRKAEEQGLDPNRWFNNVELVAAKEIGRETVQYVANIYKYYLAYKMVTENAASRSKAIKATKAAPSAKR
jgi:membrane-bound lytic murein transglycosylase MltF